MASANPQQLKHLALEDGVEIAYREHGTGAPLLLLHGITEDHHAWDELAPLLARDARVIRIDLPGHGASSPLPEYSAFTLGTAVASFVRALELPEPPHVVGHSLGGLLATLLGALVPVRSVVNVDQPLRLGAFMERIRKIALRLRGPEFCAVLNEEMDALGGPRLPERVRSELRAYRVEERRPLVHGLWLPLVDQDEAALTATLLPVLSQVRAPYLSLHGDDPGLGYGEWLRAAIPSAQTEIWPGEGHWLHRTSPERFLARVREFHAST
jgi:pimeloyl-ACP methyl ester carboxylesterase